MLVQVFVADLTIDKTTQAPLVVLQEQAGLRRLPISIGLMEASAIAAAKENLDLPRPMTHDLMANVLHTLDGSLESVVVCDLRGSTYYAVLRVRRGDSIIEIDSRPSDAIAFALRTEAPIWVAAHVFMGTEASDEDAEDKWEDFLENLEADAFGKYKM